MSRFTKWHLSGYFFYSIGQFDRDNGVNNFPAVYQGDTNHKQGYYSDIVPLKDKVRTRIKAIPELEMNCKRYRIELRWSL